MSSHVEVHFAAPPVVVFDWLADLGNRPLWQASLRAVVTQAAPPYGVGTRWVDVTWARLRPRLEVTAWERGRRWAELGHWHGVSVELRLDFAARDGGTTVQASASTRAPGPWRPVGLAIDVLGPLAVRSDLRRAARSLGR